VKCEAALNLPSQAGMSPFNFHEENKQAVAHMATTNPIQFIQEVRAQVSKIVWPTRREVLLTTVMVFIMATLTAIFFALVDLGIRAGLQSILSIFG